MSYDRRDRRGYDRRDRRDDRGYDRRDRRGYGGDRRDRRDRGYDRRDRGYDRRDDRRGYGGGYGGGRRGGRSGRGGFRGGRGGGAAGKNIVRFHDEHSGGLIQEVSEKIGMVGRHPLQQTIHEFKDSSGKTWESRKTVKNGKIYYRNVTDPDAKATYTKPDDLEATGKSYKENYAPDYPQVVEWAQMDAKRTEVSPNCFPAELTRPIYRYEVLDTEERTVYGTRNKLFPKEAGRAVKTQLRKAYEEKFGKFIICDGFVISVNKVEDDLITINVESYSIEFRNHQEVLVNDMDITQGETPEKYIQMLMYGLHSLAAKAGFIKDAHQGKTVFWKSGAADTSVEIRQRGADWDMPDVLLHRVYNLKLGVGLDPETRQKRMYAFADVSHKHLAARSLRDFIKEMKNKYERKEDYRKAVEDAFIRKRALVDYSCNWVKIEAIMWDENEEFEFNIRGKPTSIADYLKSKGHSVKSGAPCVIKCKHERRFGGVGWCEHLPQHLRVTISKERTKMADAQIKEREAMGDADRLEAVRNIMRQFEGVESEEFPLKIHARPLKIQAYVFPEIHLKIKNESYRLGDFKNGWARNSDGFTEETERDEFGSRKRIAIVASRRNSRCAEEIQNTIERGYLRKRGLSDVISGIEVCTVRDWTQDDIRDELDRLRDEPDIVIAIIDDGKEGSQQKSILARAVGAKCPTQCMVSSRAKKRPAVLGMLDDVMAKLGGCWYLVDYGLKTVDPKDFWAIGIDVYCSQNDSTVSGLSIQLCHNISAGSMRNYIRGSIPLYPKEMIAPKEAFREALKKVLKQACDLGLDPPKHILIFRGGVSMGEIDVLRTNELSGTIQACYELFGKKKSITYFLVPRGGTIRFASKLREPICVADTITGGFYQNFYTQVNTIARKTPRVVQYITLHDDGFLQNVLETEPTDWLKMIRGLCYLYPQSISFYNGPCSYPGPLKCAQNKAENFTQFILTDDARLEDCDALPDSLTETFARMEIVKESKEKAESTKPARAENEKATSTKPATMDPEHDASAMMIEE